jgi:hypothetical protein
MSGSRKAQGQDAFAVRLQQLGFVFVVVAEESFGVMVTIRSWLPAIQVGRR